MNATHTDRLGQLKEAEIWILANVAVTERPEALKLSQLPPDALSHIVAGSLQGAKPVLMFWPDGKQAHTMIPIGEDFPPIAVVIRAYRLCESISDATTALPASGATS